MGMFALGGGGDALGIDIGNSSVKLVQLKAGKSGGIELVNYGMAPLDPEVISDTGVSDAAAVANAIKDVINKNKMKRDRIFASISGQNVIMRFTKLPMMDDAELESTVKMEAEQYVPYAIEEVSIAHSKLDTIEEGDEGSKLLVLLVVAQKEIIGTYNEALKQAGTKPEVMDVDTIAVLNAMEESIIQTADSQEGGEVVAIINCGARTTSISILKRGVLMFTRNIPKGGNDITRRIVETMSCEFDQAEAIKVSDDCYLNVNEGDSSEIGDNIRTELDDLASEIRMSFDYFKAQSREPMIHRIVLTGGSANLKNFDLYLANELGVDVERTSPLEGITVVAPDPSGLEENLQQYAVAIGLALRGVKD